MDKTAILHQIIEPTYSTLPNHGIFTGQIISTAFKLKNKKQILQAQLANLHKKSIQSSKGGPQSFLDSNRSHSPASLQPSLVHRARRNMLLTFCSIVENNEVPTGNPNLKIDDVNAIYTKVQPLLDRMRQEREAERRRQAARDSSKDQVLGRSRKPAGRVDSSKYDSSPGPLNINIVEGVNGGADY